MTPERWQQISSIFKSAISLNTEERAAYLKEQCSGDDSLRAQVEKLLESHRQASKDDFIAGLAAEAAAPLLIDDDADPPPQTLTKGQQFGSYEILSALGSGGMGQVYLARDTRLDRTVALKVLSPDISQDKRRMQRFRQEARVASSLNQPNILTIFEFGEVGGLTYIATEFIDGETLRHHLQGKRLKIGEVLEISIQVLAALDAAHEARIVHRDIKPENVMVRRRDHVVKVLDFGLAKVTEKKSSVLDADESEAATEFKTAPGTIMGTVNYMSPEQALARAIDERTDIWSTAVMIYEMVAGLAPFKGATDSHTIVQILEKNPVPLTSFTGLKVPHELERIVSKALSKSPDERYQTAKDMLIDLRTLKMRLEVEAEIQRTSSPSTPVPIVPTQPSKRRVLVFVLITIAVATASILAFNLWRSSLVNTGSNVTTTVAPIVERTLTYWITVQKFKDGKAYGTEFPLAGEINFEASYHIRVHIRSPEPGYLYIFNEGPPMDSVLTEYVVVFPSVTANNNSSLISAAQIVQIPEKSWLEFDEQQGIEKLWLVFSKDALPELEVARQSASPESKNLITDAGQNKVVEDFLARNSVRKLEVQKDTLTTVKAPGNLLVYAIKLEHH